MNEATAASGSFFTVFLPFHDNQSEYFVEAIHNRHPTCRHFEQRALQTTSLDSFAYLQLCHLC